MQSNNSVSGLSNGIIRCAFYGRFSTIMQRKASIEDQLRSCRDKAESLGWILLDEQVYYDEAKSGTSQHKRAALKKLMAAARSKTPPFDYVLFDDTSRLGRDVVDVLTVTNDLIKRKIGCFFVGQQLDSRNSELFNMMLPVLASIDQNQIDRLRKKVEAGHKGRFISGYHVGAIPYGYEGKRVADLEARTPSGQGATLGTKLLILIDEAAVIVRIFLEYSVGKSMMAIARKLNEDGVRWPVDGSRTARSADGWTSEAIKRILHNERYAGRDFYKKTRILRDASTGKVTKERREAHETLWREAPELEIVERSLWVSVQDRLKGYADKNAARRKGGFARAKQSVNPWSGCLLCGECGRALTLGGVQGRATYGCPSYRNRYGCTNHLRIRCERATEQISEALSKLLLKPDIFDDLVSEVHEHLKSEWKTVRRDVDVLRGLERDRAETVQSIKNINGYVRRGLATDGMIEDLRELERQRLRLDSKIASLQATEVKEPTMLSLRSRVKSTVLKLGKALEAEPQEARDALQRHVRLKFFPSEAGEPPMFGVIGEIHLLEGFANEEKEIALQGGSSTGTTQQDDPSIFAFCMQVDPTTDEESPVSGPLLKLLADRPELSEEWLTAKEWAKLMQPYVPSSWTRNFGYGAVGRYFSHDRERLEKRFRMVRSMKYATALWQLSLRDSAEDTRHL